MAGRQLQLTLDGSSKSTLKRKSYTREFKLNVVKFYHDNGNNLYKTHKMFSLNRKMILQWISSEKRVPKD